MKISVGVSNRHVHLKENTYKKLFGDEPLEKRNDLHQVGEFASTKKVDLEYEGKTISDVRLVGPLRIDDQVELLKVDLEYLGLDAPTRRSGDLSNTPGITIINGNNRVNVDHGVIRAERHVHVPASKEDELGLHERDKVLLHTGNITFEANVKVSNNGYYELHIDKDEALEYGINNGDEIELEKIK